MEYELHTTLKNVEAYKHHTKKGLHICVILSIQILDSSSL